MERVGSFTQHELDEVIKEGERQNKKWGEQNHCDGIWSLILQEELGEAAQAMLNEEFGTASQQIHIDPEDQVDGDADKELIEAAAVILQWVASRRRQREKSIA